MENKENPEIKEIPEKKVLDLYYVPASGPCRAVQMAAKAVGVELNLKYVNLLAKDQLKPDFIKVKTHQFIEKKRKKQMFLKGVCTMFE